MLTASEIRDVWRAAGDGDHGRIVKLLLLTGQRRGEVAGMTLGRDRPRAGIWSLPAERTKNGLPHDVPLSRQAVDPAREASAHASGARSCCSASAEGPFSGWSQSKRRLNARIARRARRSPPRRPLEPDEKPTPVTP